MQIEGEEMMAPTPREYEQRMAALQAHNQVLREALREARDFVAVIEPEDGLITDMLLDQIAAALAATDKEKV